MASTSDHQVLLVAGREVAISNPQKVLFPEAGHTKLDLVATTSPWRTARCAAPAAGPTCWCATRTGSKGEFFYQKRAPESRPDWIEVVALTIPVRPHRRRGRAARRRGAGLDGEPRLPRAAPASGARRRSRSSRRAARRSRSGAGRRVAAGPRGRAGRRTRRCATSGSSGWPKTSGSRGMHVNVRIERRWTFDEVRRAALALAREVERRAPALATSKWWKEERHGVFIDYNQNAKDRTVAARLLGAADAGCARVGAARRGTRSTTCEPGRLHAGDDAGALRRGRRSARGHRRHAVLARGAARAVGAARARRPGRRAVAAALQEAAGRAAARAAVRANARRRAEAPARSRSARAKRKEDALAGLERWKARHPEAAAHLEPADVLVDAMRGRFTTWTRIRVNLQHVPDELRPAQEPLDPDDAAADWAASAPSAVPPRRPSRARKAS